MPDCLGLNPSCDTNSVVLGKLIYFSVPQFFLIHGDDDNSGYFIGLL